MWVHWTGLKSDDKDSLIIPTNENDNDPYWPIISLESVIPISILELGLWLSCWCHPNCKFILDVNDQQYSDGGICFISRLYACSNRFWDYEWEWCKHEYSYCVQLFLKWSSWWRFQKQLNPIHPQIYVVGYLVSIFSIQFFDWKNFYKSKNTGLS